MKHFIALTILLLSCTNCTTPPAHIPTGKAMPPPTGAIDYCKRNPESENCK